MNRMENDFVKNVTSTTVLSRVEENSSSRSICHEVSLVKHIYENKLFLWLTRLGCAFVLVHLLLAIVKLSELLMHSIEYIIEVHGGGSHAKKIPTTQTLVSNVNNKQRSGGFVANLRKSWNQISLNLTFRLLGSNFFELVYPFVDLSLNIHLSHINQASTSTSETIITTDYINIILGMHAFDLFVTNGLLSLVTVFCKNNHVKSLELLTKHNKKLE